MLFATLPGFVLTGGAVLTMPGGAAVEVDPLLEFVLVG
jgi:hypothetical protein